jgi:AcrR family transcriptional regulator
MYQVKSSSSRSDHRARRQGRPLRGSHRTQAARTAATRRKLIGAAARIFARDGFEAARLEDIAAAAGYTRGAFYANFADKEELFFALLEDWIGERVAELDALLRKEARNPAAKLGTLRRYYARCAKDRRLVLLSLEFALYAIRHPSAHARLRVRRRRMRAHGVDLIREFIRSGNGRSGYGRSGSPGSSGRRDTTLSGAAPRPSLPVSARATTAALGALSNALLLEHVVDPATMTEADVRRLLGAFFDAVLSRTFA